MAERSVIERAKKLLRSHRYSQALSVLEPQILHYRDDPDFYGLLAQACLKVHDWGGAKTYLERLNQIFDGESPAILSALASCQARQGDISAALEGYLTALERQNGYPPARKGLEGLRKALRNDRLNTWVRSKEFFRLIPSVARTGIPRGLSLFLMTLSIGGGLVIGLWGASHFILPYFFVKTAASVSSASLRPGPENLSLPSDQSAIQDGGLEKFTFTEEQALNLWKVAQQDFQNYQDSQTRYEINRILLSNASQDLKEHARALIPYLKAPDFGSFHGGATYETVQKAPELYEGCAVLWRGVVANLRNGKTKIQFDLLVGYETSQVIQGIVPVVLKFPALLRNSQVLDVLGLIQLDPKGRFHLQGTSVHEVGYKTP
ncbi:MAG: hypothetical protein HKM05_11570 [Spirochaetales bacterium]|nr:hypothetical protein [Spirochaetales bacterium]